jgi:hypothetical protein
MLRGSGLKSCIKFYGPPILPAIKAMEKLSLNIPEVCIMNMFIEAGPATFASTEGTMSYFGVEPTNARGRERCHSIISKSHEKIGDFDFVFEWFEEPSIDQINMLIAKIDETLKPLGVRYTITTK